MTRLERELLLSEGGGIYYDDARVPVDSDTATLFVGLGGTGADMLIRVKNQAKRRLEPIRNEKGHVVREMPNVDFMVIDTDENEAKKTWGSASFEKDEMCLINVPNQEQALRRAIDLAAQGDPAWSWYDGMGISVISGAGGIRQMGRFMLFQNMDSVWTELHRKISSLMQSSRATKLNVMIFSGISGGTGSGCFIDIAYTIRHFMERESTAVPEGKIYGYIIMPDVSLQNLNNDGIKVNGYAALKELDFWMSSGYDEQDEPFEQVYPNGKTVKSDKGPFDFCHLISSRLTDGSMINYLDVMETFADNVFAYVAAETGGGQGRAMSSVYSNVEKHVSDARQAAQIPACYRYLAIGTEKIEIPFEEILTLFGARLFQSLTPTIDKRPNATLYMADFEALSLDRKAVARLFSRDVPQMPISQKPPVYNQIWGKSNIMQIINKDMEKWLETGEIKANEAAENFVRERYSQFLTYAKNTISDPAKGPCYLSAFMHGDEGNSLIENLVQLSEDCRDHAVKLQGFSDEKREIAETKYTEGARIGLTEKALGAKTRVAQEFVAALSEQQRSELDIKLFELRADKLEDLANRLKKLHKDVFKPLSDMFSELPGIFARNIGHMDGEKSKAETSGVSGGRVVWPQEFVGENDPGFNRLLEAQTEPFLKAVADGLKEWVGVSFADIAYDSERSVKSGINIQGFISAFISEKFSPLIKGRGDMESILSEKNPRDDMKRIVQDTLEALKKNALPMFQGQGHGMPSESAKYALVSVPRNCDDIVREIGTLTDNTNTKPKRSAETNRVYIVSVLAGIPLYAYQPMTEYELLYDAKIRSGEFNGLHLRGKADSTYLASPLHEASWVNYTSPASAERNKEVRAKYKELVDSDAKIIRNEGNNWMLVVPKDEIDLDNLSLTGHMKTDLSTIKNLQNKYWNVDSGNVERVNIDGITQYRKVGFEPYANSMESILRLPRKSRMLTRQADNLKKFDEIVLNLEAPEVFAKACFTGLVARDGHQMVLKKSAIDPRPARIGDVSGATDDLLYEYGLFSEFKKLLTPELRGQIEEAYDETLAAAIAALTKDDDTNTEENTFIAGIERIEQRHENGLRVLKIYLQGLTLEERKRYDYESYFYNTLLNACKNEMAKVVKPKASGGVGDW